MIDIFKTVLPINILFFTYSARDGRNFIEVKLTYFENSDFCLNSFISFCEIFLKTLQRTGDHTTHRQTLL